MSRYARPVSTDEALALLAAGNWRILAGGTDFYPAQGSRPIRQDILDINAMDALSSIHEEADDLVLGAGVTWTDLLEKDLPPAFDALKLAAREVGSVQIQNRGTIAGNLCNASPAADGVPPLMVLDAKVELASASGSRLLPLSEFILGNRKTARRPEELLVALRVPKNATDGASHFLKLGARRYLVISIAMVATRIALDDDGCIAEAAIAVGACSPVAKRLRRLETALIGRAPGSQALEAVCDWPFDELSPIGDVRATAGYRRKAAAEITRRALSATFDQLARSGDLSGKAAA